MASGIVQNASFRLQRALLVVRFGILQRYVLFEVCRSFGLALLTITCVFVLLTVMTKAASVGLGPRDIAMLVPYMIPGSLPYTVPVSLLFAVTVVFGRLAGDNEVIASKTAGLSAWVLLAPAIFLGLALSLTLSVLSGTFIPMANNAAKKVIFKNLEDLFYKKLKMDREFDNKQWPFLIKVGDVEDKIMLNATFKERAKKPDDALNLPQPADGDDPLSYSMVVRAKRSWIQFDFEHENIRIYFEDANIRKAGVEADEATVYNTHFDFAVPGKSDFNPEKTIEELSVEEMKEKEATYRENIANERKRQAGAAAFWIASGRPVRADWKGLQYAFVKYDYWETECNKFQTEIQMRLAMAWGTLFFVVLGSPVGIRFARRDFLSAFITCFMPIILVYYPMMLFGMNMGKEGLLNPVPALWSGNLILFLAAVLWAIRPVLKH